ncbi:hypothetical protein P170DRAFT_446572 [Aspergillus steynii IBT 23096]|uniref:Nucleotidyl transferase AbiEii/AbiGii toxin family protein n=1 Tax=Aspergillus steynii IBT 23096 TaxID=1392250 RepID=A0A2I2G791_9EURO|nr:uncharacterized protein P170DRAFT_446572 [Aspergillus steynii IBT 23096]PLB48731.1 hypothetical protein P170DRAFT_446572 [Aspergillus steynii IBT 23096]
MPKPVPIPIPLRKALIECFRAAVRLVRPELRRELILVGGLASIAHSSDYYTEDLDVVAPVDVIADIWNEVINGAPNFAMEPDHTISFDASQGFRVHMDLLEMGNSAIDRVVKAEPFEEGSVASVADLFRLRAMSIVDRRKDGEDVDFRWLLSKMAMLGQILPELEEEEMDCIIEAGGDLLGKADRLALLAILSERDALNVYNRLR